MPSGLQVFNVIVVCLYLLFCILPFIFRDGDGEDEKELEEMESHLCDLDDDSEDD